MVPTQGGSILYVCTKFKAGSSFVQQLSGGPKFCPAADPFPGAQDGQNLISYRWSLPSPTDPVWWRSMYTLSSYRGNRPTNKPTNKHTHRQTGPITIHCTAKLSAQCNYKELHEVRSRNNESIGCIKLKLKILVDFWIFTLLVMIQTLGSYRYFR